MGKTRPKPRNIKPSISIMLLTIILKFKDYFMAFFTQEIKLHKSYYPHLEQFESDKRSFTHALTKVYSHELKPARFYFRPLLGAVG